MKGILWFFVILFAILAIVLYSNSIVKTGYVEVANVQMTVFAAACAVLCGVNLVGALILTAIESIHIPSAISERSVASEVVKEIKMNFPKNMENPDNTDNTDNKEQNSKIVIEKEEPLEEQTIEKYTIINEREIRCNKCGSIQPITRLNGICYKCGIRFL